MKSHTQIPGLNTTDPPKDENLVKIAENMAKTFTLKDQFETIVKRYVASFCWKHDLDIENYSWVGGRVGEVLEVSDFYFGFDDIRMDIDKELTERTIFDWYYATLEHANCPEHVNINLDSWVMGLRYKAPFTRFERLKWRLKPVYNWFHWYFVGKKEMENKLKEILKDLNP